MDALAFTNHIANLFFVPLALAVLAAAFGKLCWRRDLAGLSWWRLAWPAALLNCAVTVGGLVLYLQDGKMATYGAMVLASTLTLWWRGFVSRRR